MNAFPKMEASGKGSDFIVVTGALWDMMVERINVLCDPVAVPDSNVAQFFVSKSGLRLDLASVDSRLQALEATTGIVTYTNSSPSPTFTTTIIDQITNINSRLNGASASAACIGNTVVVTFSI